MQLLFESPGGKMEAVAGVKIKAQPDGDEIPIELDTIPQTPGEYKVTLRAEKQPGELITTNNELSTFVTVLKGGVNVLYLEGRCASIRSTCSVARRCAGHRRSITCALISAIRTNARSISNKAFTPANTTCT